MHSYNSKQTKEKYNDHKCESEFLEYLAVTFNILVVDDSFPMRKVIKKNIKASGFAEANFDEASDGSEALKILNKKGIHMMMTGYNMPNMNGPIFSIGVACSMQSYLWPICQKGINSIRPY